MGCLESKTKVEERTNKKDRWKKAMYDFLEEEERERERNRARHIFFELIKEEHEEKKTKRIRLDD